MINYTALKEELMEHTLRTWGYTLNVDCAWFDPTGEHRFANIYEAYEHLDFRRVL